MQFIGNGVRGGERVFNTAHHRGFFDGHCDLKCPRCGCLNTKFCYYNNYNLSQPRFFCKGCRRYWTKGGVLRNVPVGGSTRKTKPSKKKTGTKKPTNSQNSSCSSSISPETTSFTPNEALPTTTLFNHGSCEPQMVTENMHQLFSEMGTFRSLMTLSTDELPIVFSSAPEPEILQLTQQRDRDKVVENQNFEDWGMFDQSYWLNNNPDHQLNYLL